MFRKFIKIIAFGFILFAFNANASAQTAMCSDKTSVAASGRFDKKSFVITVAESGNTYRDGKIQRPVKSSAKLDKEEIVVNRFQSAVNKFFAETPAENLASAALDYETIGKQIEDSAAARQGCLLVKASNGVLVSIPTDNNIQARTEGLNDPVKGVKVGLGKNPSGAKLAVGSTDSDNQDGTRKWTITFDEETAVKVWQSQSKAQRGITLVKWRENLANEFTAALNKLFPAP